MMRRRCAPRETVRARVVVEATGAWAEQLLGALPPTVVQRHVFVLGDEGRAGVRRGCCDLGARELYVRGHADGRCRARAADPVPRRATTRSTPDAGPRRARGSATSALAAAPIARQWACARTFTGDRQMRLERDAERPWLVWAIGLGGHGATAAPAVGDRSRRKSRPRSQQVGRRDAGPMQRPLASLASWRSLSRLYLPRRTSRRRCRRRRGVERALDARLRRSRRARPSMNPAVSFASRSPRPCRPTRRCPAFLNSRSTR